MENEYIRREAAEKTIAEVINRGGTEAEILTEIHYLPAADVVEVRHAYKINIATVEDYVPWCKCSACGYDGLFLEDEYCSRCGAKMDGGQDK